MRETAHCDKYLPISISRRDPHSDGGHVVALRRLAAEASTASKMASTISAAVLVATRLHHLDQPIGPELLAGARERLGDAVGAEHVRCRPRAEFEASTSS